MEVSDNLSLVELAHHEPWPATSKISIDRLVERIAETTRTLSLVDLPELIEIEDVAGRLSEMVRAAKQGLEIQNDAAALQVRATCRIGHLMATMERQTIGRPKKGFAKPFFENHPPKPTLRDLGIGKTLASRARRLAALEHWRIEGLIRKALDGHRELTVAWILNVAEAQQQRARNEEQFPGGRVDDLIALAASGFRAGTIYADP